MPEFFEMLLQNREKSVFPSFSSRLKVHLALAHKVAANTESFHHRLPSVGMNLSRLRGVKNKQTNTHTHSKMITV